MTQADDNELPLGDSGPSAASGVPPIGGGPEANRTEPTNNGPFNDNPLLVVRGIGGRVELYVDRIRIVRDGLVNYLLLAMGGQLAQVETVIPVEMVSSVDITVPVFWNNYLTIAYAGAPPRQGKPIVDATAENAIFLNFFDNRDFYDFVEIVRWRVSGPLRVTFSDSQNGRGRRRRGVQRFLENGDNGR